MGGPTINFERAQTYVEIRDVNFSSLTYAVREMSGVAVKNFLRSRPWLTYSWKDYEMALQLAAELGKLDVVKVFVGKKTNIHAEDERALRWAAENNHPDVVNYLVQQGADVRALFPSVREKFGLNKK